MLRTIWRRRRAPVRRKTEVCRLAVMLLVFFGGLFRSNNDVGNVVEEVSVSNLLKVSRYPSISDREDVYFEERLGWTGSSTRGKPSLGSLGLLPWPLERCLGERDASCGRSDASRRDLRVVPHDGRARLATSFRNPQRQLFRSFHTPRGLLGLQNNTRHDVEYARLRQQVFSWPTRLRCTSTL